MMRITVDGVKGDNVFKIELSNQHLPVKNQLLETETDNRWCFSSDHKDELPAMISIEE